MPPVGYRGSETERFWRKVCVTASCWLWRGSQTKGYGQFHVEGTGHTKVLAHRWAYESLVGSIPILLQIDHLCRVRSCVNPDHMEIVDNRENTRRGVHPAPSSAIERRNRNHCLRGHQYTEANTYVRKRRGCISRECRRCHADCEAQRKSRLRDIRRG